MVGVEGIGGYMSEICVFPNSLSAVMSSQKDEIEATLSAAMHEAFSAIGYAQVASAICLAPLCAQEQELLAA